MKIHGWTTQPLEDLAAVERGKFSARPRNDPRYFGGKYPFVQTGDVASANGQLRAYTQTLNEKGLKVSKLFPAGTILVTIAANIGEVATAEIAVACPDSLVGIQAHPGVDKTWLRYAVAAKKSEMMHSATQAAQANINLQVLRPLVIETPPVEEQRRIVRVISAWERGIKIAETALGFRHQRRSGLMQQLLTGKRRLPGFTGPWKKVVIGDVVEECTVRNNGKYGPGFVRAVNKAVGMIPMKDHIMADDLSRYKIVRKCWFAYNPMRINIGSICQWMADEEALVSPDYVVFKCRDDVLDHRYFNAFRRAHRWQAFMEAAGNGSVRVRIYFDDLATLVLSLPPLDEQRRIADAIECADREIHLLEKLLAVYREQKKGLMQQLLTGKRRVTAAVA